MCKHPYQIVASAPTHLLGQRVHLLGLQSSISKHADLDHVRPWDRAFRMEKVLPVT